MLIKPVFEGLQVVFDMRVLGKGKEKYLLLRDVKQEKIVGLCNKTTVITQF